MVGVVQGTLLEETNMAVKYVKEFEFGGSVSHKKPPGMKKDLAPSKPFKGAYEGYARGGKVKMLDKMMREHREEMPVRAAMSAQSMPARAKPNAPAQGAARMESRPVMGRGQGYAKGGKVAKVMREYKKGELHSGSKKGPVVKNPKQAIAIALSEARKAGAKIPKKAKGGEIFSTEYMAYGDKKEPYRGSPKKAKMLGRQDRRAREAMGRAEKYAPGLSVDMPDRKKHGGMPVHRRKPMYSGGK